MWVYTDASGGKEAGAGYAVRLGCERRLLTAIRCEQAGAGYAVCLVAESTNGVLLAAEATGGGGASGEGVRAEV